MDIMDINMVSFFDFPFSILVKFAGSFVNGLTGSSYRVSVLCYAKGFLEKLALSFDKSILLGRVVGTYST